MEVRDELEEIDETLTRLKHELTGLKVELKFRKLARSVKAGFDPDQPRDEFGMWTDAGSESATTGEDRAAAGNQVSAVFADLASMPLAERIDRATENLGNAAGDDLRPAGAEITFNTARTGIQSIDETTDKLSSTLIDVMNTMEFIPNQAPNVYGVAVHAAFASSVKSQNLDGIGRDGVEQTFLFGRVDQYGIAGSIRTDVTLRNVAGDVIAIYDVKTGGATLSASRADQLRAGTGASQYTPVIELHFFRGSSLKYEQISQGIRIDSASGARHGGLRGHVDRQADGRHRARLCS